MHSVRFSISENLCARSAASSALCEQSLAETVRRLECLSQSELQVEFAETARRLECLSKAELQVQFGRDSEKAGLSLAFRSAGTISR